MRNSTLSTYNFCNLCHISSAINLLNSVKAISKCLYFSQSQKSNRESSHRNEKTVNHGVGGDGEMDDQVRQNIFKSSGVELDWTGLDTQICLTGSAGPD